MPNLTDLAGLASVAGAATASLMLLPAIARLTKPRLAALLGAVFLLMLIPFGGMPLAAYLRGVTGDLSITTQVLLGCVLFSPWCDCSVIEARSRNALQVFVAIAALSLYPMALGAGYFDPYRMGYGDPLFAAALLLFTLAAWFGRAPLIALCISFASLAWAIGWYESDNLWDYLLDPFVSFYALVSIMVRVATALLQRSRSQNSLPE